MAGGLPNDFDLFHLAKLSEAILDFTLSHLVYVGKGTRTRTGIGQLRSGLISGERAT